MNFMVTDLPQMNLEEMLAKMKFILTIFEVLIETERLQDLHSNKDIMIRNISTKIISRAIQGVFSTFKSSGFSFENFSGFSF